MQKVARKITKLSLADLPGWTKKMQDAEQDLTRVKQLDEAVCSGTVTGSELQSLFSATLEAGFRMPAHYASQIIVLHAENHVRLKDWPALNELLDLAKLEKAYHISTDEAQSAVDLIVDTTVALLIKQLTRTDMKLAGAGLTTLRDHL